MDEGMKRKRTADDDTSPPRSKRAAPLNGDQREVLRLEIAAVYASYDALYVAVDTGGAPQESDYLALLQACQGSATGQRLAGRLLTRFSHRFPSHLDATAAALKGLSSLTLGDSVSRDTRQDALAGLAQIFAPALKAANTELAMDILNFVMHQLQRHSTGPAAVSMQTDTGGEAAGNGAAALCLDAADAAPLWECLQAALFGMPRSVLGVCLKLLAAPGPDPLHSVARAFVEHHMLAPPPVLIDEDLADAAILLSDDEAAAAAEKRATLAAASFCRCSSKDAKSMARDIRRFLADCPHAPATVRSVLEQLLKELPAGAPSPPSRPSSGPSQRLSASASPAPATAAGMARGSGRTGGKGAARSRSRTPDQGLPQGQQRRPAAAAALNGRRRQRSRSLTPDQAATRRRGSRQPTGAGPPPSMHYLPPQPGRREPSPLDEGELPPEEAAAALLPAPGGPACVAAACLHFSNLPRPLDERALGDACHTHGAVTCVVVRPGSVGEALVSFASLRGAARCYEALAGVPLVRGGPPLRLQFCSRQAHPLGAAPPHQPRPLTTVWVEGLDSEEAEDDLRRMLQAQGGPAPTHVQPVKGCDPGALLSFVSQPAAAAAAAVLQRWAPPQRGRGGRPGPGVGRGRGPSPGAGPGGGPGIGPGPPRDQRRSPSQVPPGFAPSPGGGGGGGGPRGLPPASFRSNCLWVGQVPPTARGQSEMMAAFSQFQGLHSHRILRNSGSAFINFDTEASATEARVHMDGFFVGGRHLVVEFKEEKHFWKTQPRGARQAGMPGTGPPPALGPPLQQQQPQRRGSAPFGPGPAWERGGEGERERGSPGRPQGPLMGDYPPHRLPQPPELEPPGRRGGEYDAPPPFRRSRSPGRRWEQGLPPPGGAATPKVGGSELPMTGAPSPAGMFSGHEPPRLYSVVSEELPPAAPRGAPPGFTLQPLAAAPRASAPGHLSWEGSLGKSRQPQCRVACLLPPPGAAAALTATWAAAEPVGWPDMLDVQNRTDVQYVCGSLFPSLDPGERALRVLVASSADPGERAKLTGFASYLRSKRRAGVVALPPAGTAPARSLYLVPPTQDACRQLGVPWPPAQEESMVVLVTRAGATSL